MMHPSVKRYSQGLHRLQCILHVIDADIAIASFRDHRAEGRMKYVKLDVLLKGFGSYTDKSILPKYKEKATMSRMSIT